MALLPADPRGRKQALALIGVLVAAGWYVAKMYVVDPRQTEIDSSRAELEAITEQNRSSQILAARRDDLSERLELHERQLRVFEEFIPESEEVPELLDAISQQARLTGVSVTRIRPQAAEVGEYYTKEVYELSVLGDYHNIGRYLARIASLPRIIRPTNVQVAPAPQTRATRNMEAPLEVSFYIETFVLGAPVALGQGSEGGP